MLDDTQGSELILCSITCRARKLKCDEAKPVCGHCVKSDRECKFEERFIFRNHNIPSPKRRKRSVGARQKGEKVDESDEDQRWVEIPSECECLMFDVGILA